MNKQSGFTLIELVIVIIILGILSATAIPKFINLQSDAQSAALGGLKGALEGAATITYSRAAIDGDEAESAATSTSLGINLVFGYPEATSTALSTVTGLSDGDWAYSTSGTNAIYILPLDQSDATGTTDGCNVLYTESTADGERPVISINDDGC